MSALAARSVATMLLLVSSRGEEGSVGVCEVVVAALASLEPTGHVRDKPGPGWLRISTS